MNWLQNWLNKNNEKGESLRLVGLGNACLKSGAIQDAIKHFEYAGQIAHNIGDKVMEGRIFLSLGIANSVLDLDKAKIYSGMALDVAREFKDRFLEGRALGSLAEIYFDLDKFGKSLEYSNSALIIARDIGDQQLEGATLGNLGRVYENLNNTQRAMGCYENTIKIAHKIGDRNMESTTLGNLGVVWEKLGNAERAIEYYKQALAIESEINDVIGMARNSTNLAKILSIQNQNIESLQQAKNAVRFYSQIKHKNAAQQAQELIVQELIMQLSNS